MFPVCVYRRFYVFAARKIMFNASVAARAATLRTAGRLLSFSREVGS